MQIENLLNPIDTDFIDKDGNPIKKNIEIKDIRFTGMQEDFSVESGRKTIVYEFVCDEGEFPINFSLKVNQNKNKRITNDIRKLLKETRERF
jgi:hypothetical protein